MNESTLRYVEVKVLKKITKNLANKIVNKRTIDILVTESEIPQKVKKILDDNGIVYYDNVTPKVITGVNMVLNIEEKLKEKSLERLSKSKIELKRGK